MYNVYVYMYDEFALYLVYLNSDFIVFIFERRPGRAERSIPGWEEDLHKTAINSSKPPRATSDIYRMMRRIFCNIYQYI